MNIGVIIQARTSSTRLPNKILKDLPYGSGINVLQHVIRRIKKSKKITHIIIATSENEEDKIITEIAEQEGVDWYCGDLNDLLKRYYNAAKKFNLDIVIRITSDCPCIDPYVMDDLINISLDTDADYTYNTGPVLSYPRGLDTEIIKFSALEYTYKNAKESFEREHVTPYIYKIHPEKFKIKLIPASKENYGPNLRVTLDTFDDYILLCAIYDYLYTEEKFFVISDVIKLFERHPWMKLLNEKIIQKKYSLTLDEEIEESINVLKLQGLYKSAELISKYKK